MKKLKKKVLVKRRRRSSAVVLEAPAPPPLKPVDKTEVLRFLNRCRELEAGSIRHLRGFINNEHLRLFSNHAPENCPSLDMLKLKVAYEMQLRAFGEAGVQPPEDMLQNHAAAQALTFRKFTPELRQLISLDTDHSVEEERGTKMAVKTKAQTKIAKLAKERHMTAVERESAMKTVIGSTHFVNKDGSVSTSVLKEKGLKSREVNVLLFEYNESRAKGQPAVTDEQIVKALTTLFPGRKCSKNQPRERSSYNRGVLTGGVVPKVLSKPWDAKGQPLSIHIRGNGESKPASAQPEKTVTPAAKKVEAKVRKRAVVKSAPAPAPALEQFSGAPA